VEPSVVAPAPLPLTRWESAWRYLSALAVSAALWGTVAEHQWAAARPLFWLDIALGATAFVILRWRRRHPLRTAMVLVAFSAVSALAGGPSLIAMLSLATTRRWRWITPVAVAGFLASLVFFEVEPNQTDGLAVTLLFTAIFIGAIIAVGMYVGARRELVATLRERAERAEEEQGWRIAQARTTERARIAREMHDVLAHRLSLVAMHAGALSYRRGLSEQEVADAAEVIQSNAHQALTELREVLGVLREADAQADAIAGRPQPTLSDVPALVENARGAGGHVRLHNGVGDLTAAPASIGRSAYRVIQESLTNARKHAPDTTVDVGLHGSPGGDLMLEIRNPVRIGAAPSRTPGAGLGLIGLTERAELSGGSLEHELTDDGQFVVRASLPWPA
jgi:signal transduction histidine kinase